MIVDGKQLRFREGGQSVNAASTEAVPFERVAVFDGTNGINYVSVSGDSYPLGRLESKDPTRAFQYVGSRPVTLAFRGHDWITNRLRDRDDVTLDSTAIDGQECLVLSGLHDPADPASAYTLWLDPESKYSVTRVDHTYGGTLRHRIDIVYDRSSGNGAIPVGWKRLHWSPDGMLRMSVDTRVTDYEINPKLSSETFTIQFAPGTYVRDRRSGEQYIVREGGQKRVVLPSELRAGAGYQDLLNSETGKVFRAPNRSRFWMPLMVANLIVIAAFAWLMSRRRRRSIDT